MLRAPGPTVEAGKKRGRPPPGQVTVKLDADTCLHWWIELSSDIANGKWLDLLGAANQVFMTTERKTRTICRTTKQLVN